MMEEKKNTLQNQTISILRKTKRVPPKQLALYLYGSADSYDVSAAIVIVSQLRKKGYDITRSPYTLIERK